MPALCGSTKPISRKIVILGDGACGKTSLLNVFTRGYFPQVYAPTVFENYFHDIFVDGQPVQLCLWDTAGQEEFDRLRTLSYSDTHTIMLCFSVDSRDSLENVQTKWVGEIAEHCEGVKLVLVALKCDLREDVDNLPSSNNDSISNSNTNTNISINNSNINKNDNTNNNNNHNNNNLNNNNNNNQSLNTHRKIQKSPLISYDEGLAVAKKIGALRYLECSAKRNRGVNEAFTEAARCALTAQPKGAHSEEESSSCIIQ